MRAIDIPPVSASILWIRQINSKLTQYMKRIEDVLGRGWENHVDGSSLFDFFCFFYCFNLSLSRVLHFLGRQLKLEGDNFRQKLNTQHIFDDWVARVQAKNISLTGRIFVIEKRQKDGKIMLNLKVNFSNDVVTLFKEVTFFFQHWSLRKKNRKCNSA